MAVTTSTDIANLALSRIGEPEITAITADAHKRDRECNRWYAHVRDRLLKRWPWPFAIAAVPLRLAPGYDAYYDEYDVDKPVITGITAANPGVVTAVAHGFATSLNAYFSDIGGMTELNGSIIKAIVSDVDTLTLTGVNTTNFTAYTSGGTVEAMCPLSKYNGGYAYTMPSDSLRMIRLNSRKTEFVLIGDTVFTSDPSAVLKYIRQVTDPAEFDTTFVDILVLELAVKLIPGLVGAKRGAAMKKEVYAELKYETDEAEIEFARSEFEKVEDEEPWVDAR